jgi:hypothetical protein
MNPCTEEQVIIKIVIVSFSNYYYRIEKALMLVAKACGWLQTPPLGSELLCDNLTRKKRVNQKTKT